MIFTALGRSDWGKKRKFLPGAQPTYRRQPNGFSSFFKKKEKSFKQKNFYLARNPHIDANRTAWQKI